jgi:hypothetical protein
VKKNLASSTFSSIEGEGKKSGYVGSLCVLAKYKGVFGLMLLEAVHYKFIIL